MQTRVADYLARMADVRPDTVDVVVDEFAPARRRLMAHARRRPDRRDARARARRSATSCVWWQSRGNATAAKERWIEKIGGRLGRVGRRSTTTTTAACSARCSTGPRSSFPRAAELPAGPPSDDAVLVTCVYLVSAATPVGRAVALPRGDRRGARQGRQGARGVRLPLPGGRVDVRALPRPPHRLPARLPGRLRLPTVRAAGQRRACSARARRARAGRRGQAREVCCGSSRRRSRRAPVPAAPRYELSGSGRSRRRVNVEPATGRNRQSYAAGRSVSRSTPNVAVVDDARSPAAGGAPGSGCARRCRRRTSGSRRSARSARSGGRGRRARRRRRRAASMRQSGAERLVGAVEARAEARVVPCTRACSGRGARRGRRRASAAAASRAAAAGGPAVRVEDDRRARLPSS